MASEKQNSETFALLRYATLLNSNIDNANKLLIFLSFLLFFFFRCQVPSENLREGAGYACVNAWYIAKTLLFFPSVSQGVLLGLLIYWRSAAYARYLAPRRARTVDSSTAVCPHRRQSQCITLARVR